MIARRPDGRVEAMCSRCLVTSPVVNTPEDLADLGWELRSSGQTWCLQCSLDARTPKGQPNQRGVVARRSRR